MKRREQKEQKIALRNNYIVIKNGDSSVAVSVNSNISKNDFIRDVLTSDVMKIVNGRRLYYSVPVFYPCSAYNWSKTEQERELCKKYKSEWKRLNSGRKLTSVRVS